MPQQNNKLSLNQNTYIKLGLLHSAHIRKTTMYLQQQAHAALYRKLNYLCATVLQIFFN